MFWTVQIPDASVDVNPGAGTATYHVDNLHTLDFHDFVNDALHGPWDPATVSFTVRWGGGIAGRENIADPAKGFAGEFVYPNSATVEWAASEPTRRAAWGGPATYVGGPTKDNQTLFAVVGHERNGRFFKG